MNKDSQPVAVEQVSPERKAWEAPKLSTLDAGSAELNINNAGPDGQDTRS